MLILAALTVLAFLLILRVWFTIDTSTVSHWINLFLACNLLIVIFNLLPVKAATPFGQLGTDGWQLFHLAFQKPDEQEIQDQSYYVTEALDGLRRSDPDAALRWTEQGLVKYPDHPALRNAQAAALIETKRYSEAREVLASMLASEETKNSPIKFLLYNNIAYADLLLQNPDLLPEAEKYSADAYRQMWWMPEIIGTRGMVLVELGSLEEGMSLLRKAMGKSKNSRSRAANACHLAIAESRAGHAEKGRRYFELARKLDPKCHLLGQTAKMVGVE
jgi:tetratricopeptide (TPR) repeat protein